MQPGFFVVILSGKAQRIFDDGCEEVNLAEGLIVDLPDNLLGGVGEQVWSGGYAMRTLPSYRATGSSLVNYLVLCKILFLLLIK